MDETFESHRNLCRLCAMPMESATEENDLFQMKNLSIHQQIKELAGFMIENEPKMPRYFCMDCKKNLTQAYDFRKILIDVHRYFKKDYKNSLPQRQQIEASPKSTFDTVFLAEKVDVVVEDIEAVSADSFCEFKNDDAVEEYLAEEEMEEEVQVEVKKAKRVKPKKTKQSKQFRKYKQKKLKKIEPEIDAKTFICEQCGMSFKTMKFLEIHSVRHEEKKFQCEICSAKFFLPAELKRHQISHTGEKPVSCRFCDTRFLNKSNRNRHEKSQHLKLRPFPCDLCGKAFANSHLRKNHMVVHTKERAFDCNICQKSFLRRNHLFTHYKSTAHKKNEIEGGNI